MSELAKQQIQGDGVTSWGDSSTNNEASVTSGGELVITETEREINNFVELSVTGINADGYRLYIDLSDTTGYNHDNTGRVDISATFISIDRDNSATGAVRLGLIVRIDGTDADVVYFQGVRFEKSDDRHIQRDRVFTPNQIKLGYSSGDATRLNLVKTTNISAINTGATLNDVFGTAKTPAVGDVVLGYTRGAGTFDIGVSGFYHTETSST